MTEQDERIEDAIVASRPSIDPAFQRSLEEKLIVKHQEQTMHTHVLRTRRTLPLTIGVVVTLLIAASFFVFLPQPQTLVATQTDEDSCEITPLDGWRVYRVNAGDTLLSIVNNNQLESDSVDQIRQVNCLTDNRVITVDQLLYLPPRTGYFPVVVARQDIPRGTILEDDMLVLMELPREPFFPNGGVYGAVEQVVGEHLLVDVRASDVLFEYHLSDAPESVVLDSGMVAVRLPFPSEAAAYPLQQGDFVNIEALFMFVELDDSDSDGEEFQQVDPNVLDDDLPQWRRETIVTDAEVVAFGQGEEPDGQGFIMVQVTPDEANLLTWMLDADIPYWIGLSFQP